MASTPAEPPTLTVRSPADLLAVVPYLLGFYPSDSVVVVALHKRQLVFAARADLPPAGAPAKEIAGAVDYLAAMVAHQEVSATTVIGYGPAAPVDAVVPLVRDALTAHRIEITEVLRAHDGRFWSYLCDNPDCCPPEGTAYDPTTSPVAAAATYAGQTALPDRAALVRQVAPIGGLTRESMRQATLRAEHRLATLLDEAPVEDVLGGRALRTAGQAAIASAFDLARAGGRPTDDEVAWLSLLLTHIDVRDAAWQQVGPDEWQVELWSDVARRAEPDLVPAPASLLAFAAWRIGHGALANVALDRALREDPTYSMARLLRDALDGGVPPSALDTWPVVRSTAPRQRRSGTRGKKRRRHRRAARR
jgi:Domain of unknown function (DUF4192)